MSDHGTDRGFLERALDLARRGIGLTSPNPCVGALIVGQNRTMIGAGTHTYQGVKHAEVLAIEQAGENARGATLYVNLEPCCHQGRTPACVDAILAARIARVVACMEDPNPLASGQGLERLRAAGIAVTTGILQPEARALNEAFAKYIRHHRPLVTLKAAMTLDGKIAPPSSESHNPTALGASAAHAGWITSELARAHVQEMRHQHDAILVGVGTVIADDPRLTDRTARARRRPLLRVILDSRLRLPLESRVVQTAQDDVLVLCCFPQDEKRRELAKRGVRVEQLSPTLTGHPDFEAVVDYLGKMEMTSLMIEGGAMVNGEAMDSGIVDKVFLYYAPKILAGTASVPFALGTGFARIRDAANVQSIRLHRFGEDFAVEGYLKDPYEDAGN
ncbi:MAG TPA: bifunctional diaminohydroxyphosphoribosylaminopyrimidine deaminase/5-amino-6-(5-phosphoribosylamino)uracil reductase RibD [Terriglobales bacterium]|nr:bifunctional diaminohydroxyphosphoribosylaminopyrimidine deaminase/5-amino-6-(5-phosphoribosylamino)uracil reductase RibD [Terriglobales bacterium]